MRPILVIGAAGRVGRCITHRLAAEHRPVRLLLHRGGQASLPGPGQEALCGDFNDAACVRRACEGVEVAFAYAPRADASEAVFGAMSDAGVRRVVVLSSSSVTKAPPGANPIAERHRIAEVAVRAAGLQWTFIRPDTMASNCLQWVQDIRREGRVYAPYPDSMRNPVHEDDIARLAVLALVSGTLLGRALYITGPEILSIRQQAHVIADAIGRPLECVQTSAQEALDRMLAADPGMSPDAARRLLEYLRRTQTARPQISTEFETVTGTAPKTFAQWVGDNLEAFEHPEVAPDAAAPFFSVT